MNYCIKGLLFSHGTRHCSMENTVLGAIRGAASKVLDLTLFSVLVAVMDYCSGGRQLLAITIYALVVAAVLLCLCLHLYNGYYNARKELFSIEVDNRDKQRLAFELERATNMNREYVKAIRIIKENLRCCITLSVPDDPVVTFQGYVFQRDGIQENIACQLRLRPGTVAFCPHTRTPMYSSDVYENYPLKGVCRALHDLDSNLNVE